MPLNPEESARDLLITVRKMRSGYVLALEGIEEIALLSEGSMVDVETEMAVLQMEQGAAVLKAQIKTFDLLLAIIKATVPASVFAEDDKALDPPCFACGRVSRYCTCKSEALERGLRVVLAELDEHQENHSNGVHPAEGDWDTGYADGLGHAHHMLEELLDDDDDDDTATIGLED